MILELAQFFFMSMLNTMRPIANCDAPDCR